METIDTIIQTVSTENRKSKKETRSNKKEWAKYLCTRENMAPVQIAEKTGLSEKSINKWIADENWHTMRKVLHTTKQEQLSRLYEMLEQLTARVSDPPEGAKSPANDANAIIKITAAIKNLETETGIREIMESLQAFILFTIKQDFQAGQFINEWSERFVKEKMASIMTS